MHTSILHSHPQQKASIHVSSPWMGIPTLLAALFLLIPLAAIFWKTPWADFLHLISSPESLDALWLSLRTCLVSALIVFCIGVPCSVFLAKSQPHWWVSALRLLILVPMVLPPVVAGLALLLAWGRMGLLGRYLNLLGITIGFSTVAVIFAQVFVSLPFFIISLEGSIRTRGNSYELTALTLGASPTRTFFMVTIPMIRPSIFSAMALSISRSLGEFGATITFAGSLQGVTRTMPLQIYLHRETDTNQALALAVILIALSACMLGIAGFADARGRTSLDVHRNRSVDSGFQEVPQTTGQIDRVPTWQRLSESSYVEACQTGAIPHIYIDATVKARDLKVTAALQGGLITAVMGANGAGKSTTLELIAGILSADEGSVTFSYCPHPPEAVILQQNPLLFPHMTVLQNVQFGLSAHHVPRQEARERALEELRAVRMEEAAERSALHLSGGQAQRVAIARAMAISPSIVLLDEPFAGLDDVTSTKLRSELRQRLKASDITTIFVTHDLLEAEYLADHIVVMRNGRIVERRVRSS